jgi:hypothetical protein
MRIGRFLSIKKIVSVIIAFLARYGRLMQV